LHEAIRRARRSGPVCLWNFLLEHESLSFILSALVETVYCTGSVVFSVHGTVGLNVGWLSQAPISFGGLGATASTWAGVNQTAFQLYRFQTYVTEFIILPGASCSAFHFWRALFNKSPRSGGFVHESTVVDSPASAFAEESR
jgi:hypothetical protein